MPLPSRDGGMYSILELIQLQHPGAYTAADSASKPAAWLRDLPGSGHRCRPKEITIAPSSVRLSVYMLLITCIISKPGQPSRHRCLLP
ncbi:hypothetical protein STEG23_030447 [Scotinomys teguina]